MPKIFSQENSELFIYLSFSVGIVKEWLLLKLTKIIIWIRKSNLSSLKRNTIWLINFPNPQNEGEARPRQVISGDRWSKLLSISGSSGRDVTAVGDIIYLILWRSSRIFVNLFNLHLLAKTDSVLNASLGMSSINTVMISAYSWTNLRVAFEV